MRHQKQAFHSDVDACFFVGTRHAKKEAGVLTEHLRRGIIIKETILGHVVH